AGRADSPVPGSCARASQTPAPARPAPDPPRPTGCASDSGSIDTAPVAAARTFRGSGATTAWPCSAGLMSSWRKDGPVRRKDTIGSAPAWYRRGSDASIGCALFRRGRVPCGLQAQPTGTALLQRGSFGRVGELERRGVHLSLERSGQRRARQVLTA